MDGSPWRDAGFQVWPLPVKFQRLLRRTGFIAARADAHSVSLLLIQPAARAAHNRFVNRGRIGGVEAFDDFFVEILRVIATVRVPKRVAGGFPRLQDLPRLISKSPSDLVKKFDRFIEASLLDADVSETPQCLRAPRGLVAEAIHHLL